MLHSKNSATPEQQETIDNVNFLIKKIDRKLKTVTTDSEISGEFNYKLQTDDNQPLGANLIYSPDGRNLLGGISISQMVNQIDETWRSDSQTKNKRYQRYNRAMDHPEIEGILNIYADEVCTEDNDNKFLLLRHPDADIKEIVEDCFDRIGIFKNAWEIVRNMCAYGDDFYELQISQSTRRILDMVYLPKEAIQRVEENGRLKGFTIDTGGLNSSNNLYTTIGMTYKTSQEKEADTIHPFRIVHFRLPSKKYGVYGRSILDSVITTIENLQLMERSLMIARITRAAERRVYNIDVGILQGDKALAYAKKAVSAMQGRKRLDRAFGDTSAVEFQKDVFSASEDIVIPKRAGAEGNSIDTLPQLNNASDIGDLEYLRDKLFPGVGVPRQYLFDDQFANANLNLSSKSLPFAKKIRRIQKFFIEALYKIAIIELKLHNIPNRKIEELEIFMNNPSNIDEKDRVERDTAKWQLIATIKSLNTESVFFPDYLIYSDYLGYDDNEIVEILKLSKLQEAKQNPFEAFPKELWPDGADDLLMGTAPEGEGGETPIGPEEGMPAEVSAELGPPPDEGGGETGAEPVAPETPEVAEFQDNTLAPIIYTEQSKRERAIQRKQEIVSIINEKMNEQSQVLSELLKKREDKTITVRRNSYRYLEIHGEFKGLNTIYTQNNNIIY